MPGSWKFTVGEAKASADTRKNQLLATLTMEFHTRPGVA